MPEIDLTEIRIGRNTHQPVMAGIPEYKTWRGILARCYGKSNTRYAEYGAMGVTVCDRWRTSFWDFYADMGPKPTPKHTIDRKDGTLGYSPENCKWATMLEQSRNRKSSIKITWNGETKTAFEWSEDTGMSYWTICRRAKAGQKAEDIFEVPENRIGRTPLSIRKAIAEDYERGTTKQSELAEKYKISRLAVLYIVRNCSSYKKQRTLTEEDRNAAFVAFQGGEMCESIAIRFGVNPSSISRFVRKQMGQKVK